MTIEDANEVRDAILSSWITTDPRTKDLEHKIEAMVHADRCLCLNSATADDLLIDYDKVANAIPLIPRQ